MTKNDRKHINLLKYLFIALSLVELSLLSACTGGVKTDEFGSPVNAGYEDIQLGSFGSEAEPNAHTVREQALKDAQDRNAQMMGLGAGSNEIIP